MKKSKVFILYTGGTIGMAPIEEGNFSSPLEPKPFDKLLEFLPNVSYLEKYIEFRFDSLPVPIDSSDLKPENWIQIAEMIFEVYESFDGFIILHGTDTMAYTSSALSFMFENLAKPVIITGSQLPISDIRTDAINNFTNSIYLAAYRTFNLIKLTEVVICFGDRILRGCRAVKISSHDMIGFDSPNFPPLGRIGATINIFEELLEPYPPADAEFGINTEIDERVISLRLFPGFNPLLLKNLLDGKTEIRGMVLNTYGSGNAPRDEEFLQIISDAVKKGITILNITQCHRGMVEMGRYSGSHTMLERGVVSGLDMTPEAALTKLMCILGSSFGSGVISRLQLNLRGEQSKNLFDLRYGGSVERAVSSFSGAVIPDGIFNISKLAQAVVRITGLKFTDTGIHSTMKIRLFMNYPKAGAETPSNHRHCIAEFEIFADGKKQTLSKDITRAARSLIAARTGHITLSLVSEDAGPFTFHGLYLALFTRI